MAREIQTFTVTIPAATPAAAPVTVQTPTGVRIVSQIDWRVPPGAAGLMGWQVAMGGVKVFPLGSDTWVTAHGEHGSWPVHGAPDSGGWEVRGYNTGTVAHTVYLTFHCDPVVARPTRPRLISAVDLMPAPDLYAAGPPVRGWP